MLDNEAKEYIEQLLDEQLSVDSVVIKNLSTAILLDVKKIVSDYREEYLKSDSAAYEKRADKLARQLQVILANSIQNFDVRTEDLKVKMAEIAEQKVHDIVNGKLDRIVDATDDLRDHFYELSDDIQNTRKKTLHYAYTNAIDKKPIRTILLTVTIIGFFLGSALKVYGIELDLIEIGRSVVEFFIHRI